MVCAIRDGEGYSADSSGFEDRTEIANWVNVAAITASVFLLLSFLVLDTKWTHRHYLSICLTVAVVFMEVRFVVGWRRL
jgi:hypothetical protein